MNIEQFALQHELAVRFGAFALVLLVIGVWEVLVPSRALTRSKAFRWANNLGLTAFNTVLVRLVFPLAATGVAALAAREGWGLLHWGALSSSVPAWLAITLSVVVLDFAIWLQHLVFHAVPVLWRLHRVHHADPDYDVTTGARFHPIEICLSMLIKFAVILALGPPVIAVLIFEVMLNATAMFNHGNFSLGARADRIVRRVFVTPDMHRIHHSTVWSDSNRNFGFNLSWWDRLFGTYRDTATGGNAAIVIGIAGFNRPEEVSSFAGILSLPFKRAAR